MSLFCALRQIEPYYTERCLLKEILFKTYRIHLIMTLQTCLQLFQHSFRSEVCPLIFEHFGVKGACFCTWPHIIKRVAHILLTNEMVRSISLFYEGLIHGEQSQGMRENTFTFHLSLSHMKRPLRPAISPPKSLVRMQQWRSHKQRQILGTGRWGQEHFVFFNRVTSPGIMVRVPRNWPRFRESRRWGHQS